VRYKTFHMRAESGSDSKIGKMMNDVSNSIKSVSKVYSSAKKTFEVDLHPSS
jgi:hypothetical protein